MPATPDLLDHAVSRWCSDPHSGGAWSTLNSAGSPDSRAALGQPVGNRLILAGEATHAVAPAMVHGAWLAGCAAAEWAASMTHARVAVVGAGYAGIGAARRLAEIGLQPVVIEARARTGGRVWSRRMGETVVESGANWLQQGGANALRPLAEAAGHVLHPTDFGAPRDLGPAQAVRAIGTPGLSDAMALSLEQAAPGTLLADWRLGWQRAPGAPTPEAIDRIIAAEIELESGLALSEMTVAGVMEPGVGEGDVWLKDGLGALLDTLAGALDIRVGHEVRRISTSREGVELAGPWGSMAVDAAIVTVPVAVLQAGMIAFDPPLPSAHRHALGGLTASRVEKVSLRFEDRFWPTSASGYLRLHGPEPWQVSEWLDMTDEVGAPVLTGIFANRWMQSLWQGSDAEIATRIAGLWHRYARP